MIWWLLVLMGIVLLCSCLNPRNELRESAIRALDASVLCGLGGLDTEESEAAESAPAPLRRRREVVPPTSGASTSTRRKRATPFISKKIAARQQFRCAMCNKILQEDWEIDHIVSLQRGGSNDLSNLQALHKRCHAYKNHVEQRG